MNTVPEEIQITIYRMKHELEFRAVVRELNVMGLCGWCWGKTCCKIDECVNCFRYCELCEELHSMFNCPWKDVDSDGNTIIYDSDGSDDSDMIYLDSDSDDDPDVIYI